MPEEITTTETVETTPEAVTTETVTTETKTPEELKAELEGAQKRIHDLNKESEKRRKQLEEVEKRQEEAARQAAEEQGKFKDLYEAEKSAVQTKASELETATEKLNRLNEILGGDVDKRIEKWPDEVKNLVPSGDGVDALARFEKVSELAPLAERLMNITARPGITPGPVPSGGPTGASDKEALASHRSAVNYG